MDVWIPQDQGSGRRAERIDCEHYMAEYMGDIKTVQTDAEYKQEL